MTWNRSAADGGGSSAGTTAGDDTGLARLRELGYKQELKRGLSYVRAAGATLLLQSQLVRSFVISLPRRR